MVEGHRSGLSVNIEAIVHYDVISLPGQSMQKSMTVPAQQRMVIRLHGRGSSIGSSAVPLEFEIGGSSESRLSQAQIQAETGCALKPGLLP